MPTITGIPSAIITTTDANSASAVVSWTDPTATDNFGAVTLTSDATSGSNFPIGTTTVTFTATDPRGNQATAFFTITVTDLGIFLNSDVMGLYTSKLNNLTMRTDFSIERLPNRIGNSRSIKYDPDDKKIYVASWGEDKIFRLKPDGTDFEEFLTSVEGPYGLALDLENRIVYWTDFGSTVKTGISYINMDGTGQGEVPNSVFGPRQARVLDFGTETGFIYIGWILNGPQIRRFSHDGTTNEVLIADSDGISDPTGMVVNEAENKLYWSDRVLMKIEIYDLQTSSRTVLFQGSNSGDPRGIAEFKGYLYFFDGGSSYRIALDGSDTTPELLTYALQEGGGSSSLNSVWDLVLYNSDDSERPTITGTPSSINTTTDANSATAVVSWTDPTTSDNSGFVTLTSDATSGSKFSYGTTTVTFTATDPSGNQATDFFTITVAALPCISGIRLKQRYSTNTNSYLLTWSEPRFLRGDIWCESDEVQVHDVSSVMGSSHNYTRPWQTENSLELVLLDGVDNYTIEVTPRNTSADGQSAVEGESYFIKAIQVYPVIVDAYAGGMTFNVSIDVDVTLIDWTIELNFRRQVFKLKMENSTVDILLHNEKIKKQSRWGGYSSTCTITTGPEYQTLNSSDTLDIQMTANVWKQLRPEGDYVTGMMTQVYTISGGG
ncbi:hyalin-like [Amphiura filiformis]|uniref:hyalin-like n=1 Tax=Amphiura filiformis TaxID=82378 RepID=UPI003B21D021